MFHIRISIRFRVCISFGIDIDISIEKQTYNVRIWRSFKRVSSVTPPKKSSLKKGQQQRDVHRIEYHEDR